MERNNNNNNNFSFPFRKLIQYTSLSSPRFAAQRLKSRHVTRWGSGSRWRSPVLKLLWLHPNDGPSQASRRVVMVCSIFMGSWWDQLMLVGWLVGWLVGGWVGGWVGWLVGWLAGWLVLFVGRFRGKTFRIEIARVCIVERGREAFFSRNNYSQWLINSRIVLSFGLVLLEWNVAMPV